MGGGYTSTRRKWDRTGARNERSGSSARGGVGGGGWGVGELTKRGFGRARTEPGSMIGFTPPTIQFRI